uniref:I/LWEQ domain-containing protein n=1 Tax=Strigamia maritima TaxID=126957 RepID=T1IJU8_STRMM
MSSIPLSRVLQQRRGTSLDVQREVFEKAQALSITKAVNSQETPAKEKHIRNTIIGTFQEKGAGIFWNVVTKLPLQGNPIVCWKFCHTLHKLLREGHQNVLAESLKFKSEIEGLGKLWGHLKEGYGRLIACYCKLLVVKLDFHTKNPRFPGNLQVTADQLEDICDRDVNNYFQMTVEMFDYMDEILNLQATIFGSLDMSRSNSMTSSGQCRLAPLIPCIQDSSHLYDFCVKLLFKLHSSLPPDTLIGHSDRFRHQFSLLRQFYLNSSTLQYFKHLIQIPLLPDNPPNFLVQGDLSSHLSPVVILPPRPETPDNDSLLDMTLVDMLNTTDETLSTNGTTSPETLSEKDRLIDQLLREIHDLKEEILKLRAEADKNSEDLRNRCLSLESQVTELGNQLENKIHETNYLQKQINKSVEDSEAMQATAEKKAKVGEEKFLKMKDVYTKLREEHIALLRGKAEIEKQLSGAMKASEEANSLQEIVKSMDELKRNKDILEQELYKASAKRDELTIELAEISSTNSLLEEKLIQSEKTKEAIKQEFTIATKKLQNNSLVNCIDEVESLVQTANDAIDGPSFTSLTCSPEYFLTVVETSVQALDKLVSEHSTYLRTGTNGDDVLKAAIRLGFNFSECALEGAATANSSANVELGHDLSAASRETTLAVIDLLKNLKEKSETVSISQYSDIVRSRLKNLTSLSEGLMSNKGDIENLSEMVEDELTLMDKAIEEAANRIEDLMKKTRQADSGVKLEVNSKILESCTALMQAIRVLVQRSKTLQEEIVSQGKGSTSAKEFYKRNHRWTEGLLSAAKAVGLGAQFLVNAADKVMDGKATFAELMVASQEIAASTAQLVVASKVKADRNSENLTNLSRASKGVTEATGTVVATAKSCAELLEERDVMDFTKLSLHQAKRLEMESQVRVLELESNLAQERIKLARLRKQHYTLAGPSEGWEEEDIPK